MNLMHHLSLLIFAPPLPAKEVRDNYLSDLNSHTAKKKNEELEALGLPRLPQFKDEFLRLCDELDLK